MIVGLNYGNDSEMETKMENKLAMLEEQLLDGSISIAKFRGGGVFEVGVHSCMRSQSHDSGLVADFDGSDHQTAKPVQALKKGHCRSQSSDYHGERIVNIPKSTKNLSACRSYSNSLMEDRLTCVHHLHSHVNSMNKGGSISAELLQADNMQIYSHDCDPIRDAATIKEELNQSQLSLQSDDGFHGDMTLVSTSQSNRTSISTISTGSLNVGQLDLDKNSTDCKEPNSPETDTQQLTNTDTTDESKSEKTDTSNKNRSENKSGSKLEKLTDKLHSVTFAAHHTNTSPCTSTPKKNPKDPKISPANVSATSQRSRHSSGASDVTKKGSTSPKQSWLLRLFESKMFNMSIAISYLYNSKEPGVQTYIGKWLLCCIGQLVKLLSVGAINRWY